MKPRVLLIAFALLTTLCLIGVGAPRIEVDQAIYDFGSAIEGTAILHVFVLSNTGNQDLVITGVRVSCHCTTTTLPSHRIPAGERLLLSAMLDTSGFSGKIGRTMTVDSNDPSKPQLSLAFTGTVERKAGYQESAGNLMNEMYVLIDIRPSSSYVAGHLIGAMNVPLAELAERAVSLPADVLVVAYDADGRDIGAAVTALRNLGIQGAYGLRNGYEGWIRGYGDAFSLPGYEPRWGSFVGLGGVASSSSSGAAQMMEPTQLRSWLHVLLDLRPPSQYAAGHLAGALNVQETAVGNLVSALPRGFPVFLYCQDGVLSDRIAATMWQRGNGAVRSVVGGLDQWMLQFGELYLVTSPL